MDLNQLNPTQYMWIITKTNKPLMSLLNFCFTFRYYIEQFTLRLYFSRIYMIAYG
jgi:hypothetical protein